MRNRFGVYYRNSPEKEGCLIRPKNGDWYYPTRELAGEFCSCLSLKYSIHEFWVVDITETDKELI